MKVKQLNQGVKKAIKEEKGKTRRSRKKRKPGRKRRDFEREKERIINREKV